MAIFSLLLISCLPVVEYAPQTMNEELEWESDAEKDLDCDQTEQEELTMKPFLSGHKHHGVHKCPLVPNYK